MRKLILIAAATALVIAGGASPAAAAPAQQETIPLVCDNGQAYDVAVAGNGDFTPGRVVGSQQVLVPTSFGDFHIRAVLPDGTVVEDSFPGSTKGGGNVEARNPQPTVMCTFEQTEVLAEDDPESGFPAGTEITFSGEVTAFLTGR
jgi:uncharacterized membrane protein